MATYDGWQAINLTDRDATNSDRSVGMFDQELDESFLVDLTLDETAQLVADEGFRTAVVEPKPRSMALVEALRRKGIRVLYPKRRIVLTECAGQIDETIVTDALVDWPAAE